MLCRVERRERRRFGVQVLEDGEEGVGVGGVEGFLLDVVVELEGPVDG